MILATGDMHMPIDGSKINSRRFREQKRMSKADYVVVAGDMGIVWDGSRQDMYLQNELDARSFTSLFVDGNHENHRMLNAYPTEVWNGGRVHRVKPTVLHLMRGQIFEIDGHTFFTMGGAKSVDTYRRREGRDWWPEEMPAKEEFEEALDNLSEHHWEVDFLITHAAPLEIVARLPIHIHAENDPLYSFLGMLYKELKYRHWYFGHYHVDAEIDERHTALFDRVVRIA